MSVNPVTTAQNWGVPKTGAEPGTVDSGRFEEVLASKTASGGAGGRVSAEIAAEALRLKMLSSALSIGVEQEQAAPSKSGVQGLLNKFLAQLPNGGATALTGADSSAAADPVALDAGQGAASGQNLDSTAALEAGLGSTPTDAVIAKASQRYGVDAGLIKAVIKAESNFNPRAVSSAGAQGLMQLMPATARGLGVRDSFDPEQNVMAGTRFLKDMLQRYGGNLDEALAAYNWGPGNVDRHGSSKLPRETREYLSKVKGYYSQYIG